MAAILFILDFKGFVNISDELLYFAVVIIFSLLRLFAAFGIDPFAPFENLFCSVFMGGLMDSLKRAAAEKPEDAAAPTASTAINKNNTKAKEE